MGQELECRMHRNGRTLMGKAYLETDHLLFRGAERLKIPFKDLQGVSAAAGVLTLKLDDGPAEFELGKAAEKWAGKILNPPSRVDKLGVKPGLTYRLVGKFEEQFEAELTARGALPAGTRGKADIVFYAAETADDLARISKLAAGMKPEGGLWVVYPKGVTVIREIDVLQAGRAAGLKDVKVASFAATLTALRFVIPLADR